MSTKQSQMVAGKSFYAGTVGFLSQKQEIHSWKVSERLRVRYPNEIKDATA